MMLETMQNGVIIDIKVQSINNLITNSSSEVFCTITGQDIQAIYEILKPLFTEWDPELYPYISLYEENEWNDGSPALIRIDLPYGYSGVEEFYKEGLPAILDKYLGGHYTIKYAD